MSVIEKLEQQQRAKQMGVEIPDPPTRINGKAHYGLKTIPLGMGVSVWGGFVDKEMATLFVENYIGTVDATLNRDVSDPHVKRIEGQISNDKWAINGDTTRFDEDDHPIDGQHRLWAIIYSGKPVWMILIFGIKREAMPTIDTIRKSRSGADVMAIEGVKQHRAPVAGALSWLIRYQRGLLSVCRGDDFRVENADIVTAYEAHPQMLRAVERVRKLRRLVKPAIVAFVYYVVASHDLELAERMIVILEEPPAGLPLNDPIYVLRNVLMGLRTARREPQVVLAMFIKAVNAAHAGTRLDTLTWRSQGANPESFPLFWWQS